MTYKANISKHFQLLVAMNTNLTRERWEEITIHTLKDLFEDFYGVKIIEINDRWAYIEFASKEDYTMAVLKWM